MADLYSSNPLLIMGTIAATIGIVPGLIRAVFVIVQGRR